MGRSIFDSIMPGAQPQMPSVSGGSQFANPIEKVNYILNTLTNPAAFVKQQFPDIPDEYMNDPNKILQYLQQSRGISDQMLQQLRQKMGGGA